MFKKTLIRTKICIKICKTNFQCKTCKQISNYNKTKRNICETFKNKVFIIDI